MKANFLVGVDTVYNAVIAKGATPSDKSPSAIAAAISSFKPAYGLLLNSTGVAMKSAYGLSANNSLSIYQETSNSVHSASAYAYFIDGKYNTFKYTFSIDGATGYISSIYGRIIAANGGILYNLSYGSNTINLNGLNLTGCRVEIYFSTSTSSQHRGISATLSNVECY